MAHRNEELAPLVSETKTKASISTGDRISRRLFWMFLICHIVIWTVIPTFVWPNLSLDQAEMLFWGHEWIWGTTKHPPLPGWICELVTYVFGCRIWAQYLVAQIAIAAAIWSVWKLARELLTPPFALFAACLMESNLFCTINSLHLNNNIGMFPCWTLCIIYLYWAIRTNKTSSWLAVGFWLGLGMLVKYTTGVLALVILAFGLCNSEARKSWRYPGPYLAISLATLIFLPHMWWVVANDYCTFRWVTLQVGEAPSSWAGHFYNPVLFLLAQIAALSPFLIVMAFLNDWSFRFRLAHQKDHFPQEFLAAMFCGPVAIHLFISMVMNVNLNGSYGGPLWLFVGVWFLSLFEFPRSDVSLQRAWNAWGITSILVVVGWTTIRILDPWFSSHPRTLFPGSQMALTVDRIWKQRFGQPLKNVAGDYWLAGTLAFFSSDRPRVHQDVIETKTHGTTPEAKKCPWMSDDDYRREGGVIVWNRDLNPKGPNETDRLRFAVTETVDLPLIPYQTWIGERWARISLAITPPVHIDRAHSEMKGESPN